jgi:MFS family permease
MFAIFVAYFGNRFHRMAWLGAIFMLQAFVCVLVIIPTLVHHSEDNNTLDAIELPLLCIRQKSAEISTQMHSTTTLVLLFVLQLFIGLGIIAFYTLGFSYLDDNVYEHESPALIAGALAARFTLYINF